MGIDNLSAYFKLFYGNKTAAKLNMLKFLSTKLLKYHLFLSTHVRYVLFPSSFVSSKAQTVHLYSLK
jgi:hypothetical protein